MLGIVSISIRGNKGLPFLIVFSPICSFMDSAVRGIKGAMPLATSLIASTNKRINALSSSVLFSLAKFQGFVSSIYLLAIFISFQISSKAEEKLKFKPGLRHCLISKAIP